MTGHETDISDPPAVAAEDFAAGLARRNEAFRTRILQTMILGALVLRPLPPEVAEQVGDFARAMSVDDGMLTVAQRFAKGQLGLAAVDFDRNGYTATWDAERAAKLSGHRPRRRMAALHPRPRARVAVGRSRGPPGRDAGPANLGVLRGPGLRLPRHPRLGAAVARPARLGARPRRLRLTGRVRAGGLRLHRQGERRPARVLAARHGRQPLRDRVPGHGCRALRVVPRASSHRTEWPSAGGRRTPSRSAERTASAASPTSTSSPSTGSPSPTSPSNRSGPRST